MDNRAIGVFDSGFGGLTAVRQLHRVMPQEHIIYFGDSGRVPYGSRGRSTIIKYARQDINFLLSHDIKAIVVACGTVSSVALDVVRDELSIPIIGVVKPACHEAIRRTKNNRVGVIGTRGTIRSGSYGKKLHAIRPEVETMEHFCPLFVPLVENGRFAPTDPVVRLVVEEYLEPFMKFGIDTLILGCTHYPLLADAIQSYLGDSVELVDSGAEAANYVKTFIDPAEAGHPHTEYYISDDPSTFAEFAPIFLGESVHVTPELVDIASY